MYNIETNIPIPVRVKGNKGHSKYPIYEMKIGDSFFIPITEKLSAKTAVI